MSKLRARSVSRRRGQRGATLAALLALVAISALFMSAMLTDWSFIMRREREKELIFRGTAIARAVEEYRSRGTGTWPTSLEQMTKLPKPALRHAYPDPMTARYDDDGKLVEGTGAWDVIAPDARQGGVPPPSGAQPPESSDPTKPRTVGGTPAIGPIAGVKSTSEELSIGGYGDFEAETPYNEWEFKALLLAATALDSNSGGVSLDYPPGFGGLRLPGGPPFIREDAVVTAPPQPRP